MQGLSSHSIVSSPRTVRSCSPWGSRLIGRRTTWSAVCPSAPHSLGAEGATHQKWKRLKVRSPVVFSNHSAFRRWCTQSAALLLLSDELMSCCAAGTNDCFDLGYSTFPFDWQVSTEWSRCPGSMAWRHRDKVAPLRRSSVGWMSARIGWLSSGGGRRRPVPSGKMLLMTGPMMTE